MLADKCDFGSYLEQALRDWLVCGLRQEAIQRKVLTLEDSVTFKKYMEWQRAWKWPKPEL